MSQRFPKVMGILNVTPDSFSDGGLYQDINLAHKRAMEMLESGADIIDIGGESTRPGAESVSLQEELNRVIPLIKLIKHSQANVVISIDTTKYEVAKAALETGATMINDVSCLRKEKRLVNLSGEYNVPLIIMHSRNTPKEMLKNADYKNVVSEVTSELKAAIQFAENEGLNNIMIDPGIGFAKNYCHNIEILRNLDKFEELKYPIVLGISRKRFIGKMLGLVNPVDRDLATMMIHSVLLNKNIEIIRVHNVELAIQLKTIYEELF
ncbi:MAG: dihydropteroate synthase [Candidatus Kapabacteria bacterium]|nr:dihydropteroate synthase [Ignavibacteriota bacterium]MCW5886131.1 dihydropteroate synthase [Candidatus Kapabacteria bacterium]